MSGQEKQETEHWFKVLSKETNTMLYVMIMSDYLLFRCKEKFTAKSKKGVYETLFITTFCKRYECDDASSRKENQ